MRTRKSSLHGSGNSKINKANISTLTAVTRNATVTAEIITQADSGVVSGEDISGSADNHWEQQQLRLRKHGKYAKFCEDLKLVPQLFAPLEQKEIRQRMRDGKEKKAKIDIGFGSNALEFGYQGMGDRYAAALAAEIPYLPPHYRCLDMR